MYFTQDFKQFAIGLSIDKDGIMLGIGFWMLEVFF